MTDLCVLKKKQKDYQISVFSASWCLVNRVKTEMHGLQHLFLHQTPIEEHHKKELVKAIYIQHQVSLLQWQTARL